MAACKATKLTSLTLHLLIARCWSALSYFKFIEKHRNILHFSICHDLRAAVIIG